MDAVGGVRRKPAKTTIYLRPIGKRKLVGDPRNALPGDIITYFEDGRYTTREVRLLEGEVIVTEDLVGQYGKLADSVRVRFDDIDEILRVEQVPECAEPEVEPTPPEEPLEPVKPSGVLDGIRMPGPSRRPKD